MTVEVNTDDFAMDFLHAARSVAERPEHLLGLNEAFFHSEEGDTPFTTLMKAVVRLRMIEKAIMESLADMPGMGPREAGTLFKDLSRSAILVTMVHDDAAAGRLAHFFPHLLSKDDIDRIRTMTETGHPKEDATKALALLEEIQRGLSDRLKPKR